MNKVLSPTGVVISMTLRELAGYYDVSESDFVCICIAGLADTIHKDSIDYTHLSHQVGMQWWGKVLRKDDPEQAKCYSFMEGWNYGTEYSVDEFRESIMGGEGYDRDYFYDREYRKWVFEKVISKFNSVFDDIELVFNVRHVNY